MNDSEGKKWTLKQINRRHRVWKNGRIEGYTLSELQKFGGQERKKVAGRHGMPYTTAYGKQLRGISHIPEMPPGENKIKAYVMELEKDGEIRYHNTLQKKRKVAKKKKNDYGGGRGNRKILVPTDPIEKMKHAGDIMAINIDRLRGQLEEYREMDNDKIGVEKLARYVTIKNVLFKIPVERAHFKISKSDIIFEYIHKQIADVCDEVDDKIRKDKRLGSALLALEKLASSDEFLYKGSLKIGNLGRDDLAIAKYVNVIRDLEKLQDSAGSTKPLGVTFTEHTKLT